MATFFLDASALVKRYDQAESGARRVLELCESPAEDSLLIGPTASIELASALNRKRREGRLTRHLRDSWWEAFQLDLARQYRVVQWNQAIRSAAERLVFVHPLRAYDAVQLAAALQAGLRAGPEVEARFCTADRLQAQAAEAEGLTVELIF